MRIEKFEIAGKLKKIKGVVNSKVEEISGIVVNGNTLYATNTEISIRATLNIPTSDEHFVIPREAVELIENLPDDTVEITSDGASVHIKCGKIKNKFRTYDVSNYPTVKEIENVAGSTTISSDKLLDALNSVLYAVSDTPLKGRETLRGVLMEAQNGTLNIVGCDGYRMAWSKIVYDGEFKVIIPKAAVRQILSIGISGDISIEWDNSGVKFKSNEYEIYSRIISGEYLKYKDSFKEHPNRVNLDRKTFSECLRRAIICIADTSTSFIRCTFNGSNLAVSLHKSESEYEEDIALAAPVDGKIEIGFNGRYLVDALKSFSSDTVCIDLGGSSQPIIIGNGNLQALVLPVRLYD